MRPSDDRLLELLVRHMGAMRREIMLELLFDEAGMLCGHQVRCDGEFASVSARYRRLFEHAFEVRASGIVLVHNHPSGDSRPSPQDIVSTRRLAAVARPMDLEFHDHVVIGGNAAVSMRKAGLMS